MKKDKIFRLIIIMGVLLSFSSSGIYAKTLTGDIIVVGSGAAGMNAAVAAAKEGAKAIVFEKAPFPGGTSNLAMGVLSPQKENRDKAFREIMDYTHWRANASLVRAYVNKSSTNREWFEELGVEIYPPSPDRDSVMLKAEGRGHGGRSMINTLVQRAEEMGVEIYVSTPVKDLIKEGDGVTGVIAEDKSGNSIKANAKAVIIATGGFGNSKEMVKEYAGFDLQENMFLMMDLQLVGDGIKMAWKAGAAREGMGMHMIYNVPGPGIVGAVPWHAKNQIRVIQMQPHLWVNQNGERFLNEAISANSTFTGNAIARQKGRCAYLIFDGSIKRTMEEAFDRRSMVFPGMDNLIDLEGQIKGLKESGNKNVFTADSLEELAISMGINPNVLKNTVEEYNSFCEKGHDDLFAKDPKYLRPVKEPKFYAFRIIPSAYGTMGGIQVNERLEVLDGEQNIIHGLYASGYDAFIIYGDIMDYDWNLPGMALSFALNSGRMAGENAVKYLGI